MFLGVLALMLALTASLPSTAAAAECTNTWTGPAEGSWTTAANWSAGHVPTETDVACIGSGKTVNILASGTQKASVVQGEGALKLEKSTLELLSGSESSQIKTLTAKFEGNLAGAGTLKVTGSLAWSSESTMSGSGATIIEPGASASLTGAKAKLVGREFVNNGTLSYTRQILMSEGAVFKNVGTVLAKAPEAIRVIEGSKTAPSFVNIGTFKKPEGTGSASISVNFENRGTVNGETGQIKFEGSTNSLTFADESNLEGTIVCEKIAVTANSLSAPKVVLSFREEQVTIPAGKSASFGTLTMNYEGNVTGSGILEVTKAFSWAGASTMSGTGKTVLGSSSVNTIGSANVDFSLAGRKLLNEGTVTQLTYSTVRMKEGGVFENLGTYNANGDKSSWQLRSEGTGSTFINKGLFRKTEGTGTLKVWSDFENPGTVQVSSGQARFESDFENAGTVQASVGSVTFNGASHSVAFADESNLEGTIICEKASVTLGTLTAPKADISFREEQVTIPAGEAVSISTFRMKYHGDLGGAGSLEVTKSFAWEGESTISGSGKTVLASSAVSTIGSANVDFTLAGRRLVNEGTITQLTYAKLSTTEGGVFENLGTYNANGEKSSNQIWSSGTGSKFVNKGTLQKTEGTGRFKVNSDFENLGTMQISTGEVWCEGSHSLVFDDGSSIEGTLTCEGPSVTFNTFNSPKADLSFREEPITVPAGESPSVGTLRLRYNGDLSGSGDLKVTKALLWEQESTMSGSGKTTLAPGSVNVLTAGATTPTLTQRTLINEGTFTHSSSSRFNLNGGAVFKNQGTYNLNAEPYPTWVHEMIRNEGGGSGRFVNKGTFQRTEGKINVKVLPEFENHGVIKEQSSKVEIENPVTVKDEFGKHCKEGDPVDCATGNFSESQTDISIGGRGIGLYLTRSYSAQTAAAATSAGAFGYGWSGSFSDHLTLEEAGAKVTLTRGDGSTIPFTRVSGTTYSAPAWSQEILSGSPETGFTFMRTDQTELHFSGAGRLESIVDRNGNATTLSYDEAGRLKAITDPAGRQIALAYNEGGQVKSAEDPMGHVVKYAYEGGNLTSVTMPGEEGPRWQFKYDASHRITTLIDGRGGKTTNEYDGSNRVVSQTDPAGRTLAFEYNSFHTKITNKATGAVTDEWFTSDNEPLSITRGYGTAVATTETFSYNDAGQITAVTDGNGHMTTYGYDAEGNQTSEKDAAGETKWIYNATHDIVSMTTARGETTTIERDPNGNVESISRPGPEKTTQTYSFSFDKYGQLEDITDPLKRTWTFAYDEQGDRISEGDSLGNTQTFVYDESSRLISTVTPLGNVEGAKPAEYEIMIERDLQGRPLKVVDPLGRTTEYVYDGNGNLTAQTDANGHSTKYTYNADNEQIKIEKPNGAILETGYDGAGEVASQTDANERKTTYIRNVLEEPVEVIDPLGRKTIEEFDAAGNLTALIDPAERKTSYNYDAAGRLIEVNYSEEATPVATFDYDADGNVVAMSDGTGKSSFEYDQLNRLTRSEDGHGDVVSYGYNLGEELTTIAYPNGKSVSHAYDAAGRLESVTDWLGGTTGFSYDANSNLEAITFPTATGNVDEYVFDRADRMIEATFTHGAETLASLAYSREKLGQIEKEVRNGLPGPSELSIAYDKNDRLTEAGAATFEYDPADNLTKGVGSTNTYDAASQLETGTGIAYSYDKIGERTKATPTGGPATAYKYNQLGNLLSVERPEEGEAPAITKSFAYDGAGRLASDTTGSTTRYLAWDLHDELPLLLYDGQYSYLYGPGGLPISQISATGTVTYLHHDQLGSTRLLTSGLGEATGALSYYPYGSLEAQSGTATTSLGFAAQYTDSQTGLQYLRARFYDPSTAQFLTRDPLVLSTRAPYNYAYDNPLNLVDPSGMGPCILGVIACDEDDDPCDSLATGPLLPLCLVPDDATDDVVNASAGAGDEFLSPPLLDINGGQLGRDLFGINNVDTCSSAYKIGRGGAMFVNVTRTIGSGADLAWKYGPDIYRVGRTMSRRLDEKFVHAPIR